MKDFLSLASRRQSDRAFDPQRPVEKEKLQRILEAACIAPSACNSQPWHFIVVDDPELKNRVADATSNRVVYKRQGLGSCIVGWFDETKVRKLLDIPSGKRVLLDIVIGYSTQPDRPKKRKDLKEVISYNRY